MRRSSRRRCTDGANIGDLGEEHGHRVLRVRGKGGKVVLIPPPPTVGRAIDRAVHRRQDGPILRNTVGARMDRHAATRQLKHLAATPGVRMPRMHHTCCAIFATTMPDAGVSLRDVQIAARHADPSDQPCATTAPARTSTATPNYILAAYPKPALLHRAEPYLGLTNADFDAVHQWL